MALNGTGRDYQPTYQLPCGRLVEDVFDDLEAGRLSEHSAGCPHCRAAARGLEALNEATRALLEDPAEPPRGLAEQIMAAVRAEVRRGRTLPLPGELGPVEVSVRAVAVVLRYAADTVPGVRARQCRVEPDPERPDTVRVELAVSLRYGAGPADALLAEVRRRVAAALAGRVGVRARTVDLLVTDIWGEA